MKNNDTASAVIVDEDGEYHAGAVIQLEKGKRIVNAADKETRRRYAQKSRNNRLMQEERKHNLEDYRKESDFFFIHSTLAIACANEGNIARYIYLCSFLDFRGMLKKEDGSYITKQDLPEILLIGRTAAWSFLKCMSDYLTVDEKGRIGVNRKYAWRGTLTAKEKKSMQLRLFWVKWVRSLYLASQNNIKQIGYVFSMLPNINVEWNVLCCEDPERLEYEDPDMIYETDLEKIRCMTSREFCLTLGKDLSNWGKIWRKYENIVFEVNDHQEAFIKRIEIYEAGKHKEIIFVNPRILYSGTKPNEIAAIAKFTDIVVL